MTNSTNENQYFNNSTSTPAVIHEVKRITPARGDEFVAIKASMLDGKCDNPSYENIDLIVKGEQAMQVLTSFENLWPTYGQDKEKRTKIFANLRIGSLGVKPYLTKKGDAAATLSGRLIKINYCKVNDVVVDTAVGQSDASHEVLEADQTNVDSTETTQPAGFSVPQEAVA